MAAFKFKTLEDALDGLKNHEQDYNCRYAVLKSTKGFGDGDVRNGKQVMFQDKVNVRKGHQEFTGIPFIILGQKVLECQYGKNRKMKDKMKQDSNDHQYVKGTKFFAQPSKKMDCPAMVTIRELVRFPSYKVEGTMNRDDLRKVCLQIMFCISTGQQLSTSVEYILCLPNLNDHKGHPVDEIEEEICQARTGKEARCSWYKGTLTMEIRNIGTEFSFPINNRGCYYAESAAVPANGCHEVSNLNEMKSALDDIIVSVKSNLSLKNFQGTRCLAKETYGDMSSAASYFYKLPLNLVIGNVLVMFVLKYA